MTDFKNPAIPVSNGFFSSEDTYPRKSDLTWAEEAKE